MKPKPFLGWSIITLLALAPVLMLLLFGPRGSNIYDYSSFTHFIGQSAGLIGMTLLVISFILSTRWKLIERIFGGLDKVYNVHHIVGVLSLIFIFMHPIFLVLKFVPADWYRAATYLLPGGLVSVDLGIYALLGLIILIALSVYFSIRYDYWKISHKFMGAVFILAALHILLVRGTASRDYIFTGYYAYAAIVSIIGFICFIYTLLIKSEIVNHKYRINAVKMPCNGVYEISMTPVNEQIHYKAGQFVFLKFHSSKLSGESHPFSIASSSDSAKLKVIVKGLGDFTDKMGELSAGEYADVEGPYGNFNFEQYYDKDQIWIAGGIGVTPFIGMAKDIMFKQKLDYNIHLYYSVKDASEFVCIDDFLEAQSKTKGFRVIAWVDKEKGFLNADIIMKYSGNLPGKEFFICGPKAMKSSIKKQLLARGVPISDIHMEDFDFR